MGFPGRFAISAALFASFAVGALAAGCAIGSDGSELFGEENDGGSGTSDAGDGSSPFQTPVDAGGKKDGASAADGGADSAARDSGTEAGRADGGASDSGSPDANTADSGTCTAVANSCNSADDLGSVAGDINNDSKSASGYGTKWLRVAVTEDSTSVLDMSARIQLVSPAGSNYDLFIYKGLEEDDGGGVECSTVSDQSNLPAGQSDIVNYSQVDTTGLFGWDNGRILSIEVRHVAGPCGPSTPWQLTIDGHTSP